MDLLELRPGLWRWTAPHPDWTPEQGGADGWERDVGCLYYEAADELVLIDPLAPPAGTPERDRFWRALDRDAERLGPPAVLLTVFWHERSAHEVVERYPGATLWAHERALDRLEASVTNAFRLGDPLPGGAVAIEALRADEVLFWLPAHGALVAGDVLLGNGSGGVRLCPDSWLPDGTDPREFRASLRALLDLPVEMVLVSHGEPVLENGRDALAGALEPHSPPSAR